MSNKRTRKDRYNTGNSSKNLHSNIGKNASMKKKSVDYNANANVYNDNANSRYKDDYANLDGQADMFNYSDRLDYGFDIRINDMSGGTTTINSKNIDRKNSYFKQNRNNVYSNGGYDSLENAYVNVDSNDEQYSRNKYVSKHNNATNDDSRVDNNTNKSDIDNNKINNTSNKNSDTQTSNAKQDNTINNSVLKEEIFNNALKEANLKENSLNNIGSNKDDNTSDNKLSSALKEKLEGQLHDIISDDNNAQFAKDSSANSNGNNNGVNVKSSNKRNNRRKNRKNNYNNNNNNNTYKNNINKNSSKNANKNVAQDDKLDNSGMELKDCTTYYFDMTDDYKANTNSKNNNNNFKENANKDNLAFNANASKNQPSNYNMDSMANNNKENTYNKANRPQESMYNEVNRPNENGYNEVNRLNENGYNEANRLEEDTYNAMNEPQVSDSPNKKEKIVSISNASLLNDSLSNANQEEKRFFDPFAESNSEYYGLEEGDFNKKDKTSPRYKRVKRMFILEAVMFVFMVLGIYALKFMVKYNGVLANKLDEKEIGLENTVRKEGYRTIALYGIDADDEGTTRSDSIIVANINQTNGEVKLVAVYRDTYLYVPGWEEKSGSEFTKINAAYVVGDNDKQHVENAIKALNQNLALHITDYMAVNFAALAQIVDAIGGVEVNIPKTKNFTVYMNKFGGDAARSNKAKYKKVDESILGKRVRLNGYQALGFCRVRKATSGLIARYPLEGESDYTRSQRQREVINEIVKEVKKAGIGKLRDMLEVFQNKKNINTSFSWSDLIELASEGIKYDYRIVDQSYSFPQETHTVRIPGGENGQCVEFSNFKLEDEVRLLHKYMYPDKILSEDELKNVKKVSERLEGYKQSYDPEYSMSISSNEKKLKEAYKKLENNGSSSEDKEDKKKEDSKSDDKSEKDKKNSDSSNSKKNKKKENE